MKIYYLFLSGFIILHSVITSAQDLSQQTPGAFLTHIENQALFPVSNWKNSALVSAKSHLRNPNADSTMSKSSKGERQLFLIKVNYNSLIGDNEVAIDYTSSYGMEFGMGGQLEEHIHIMAGLGIDKFEENYFIPVTLNARIAFYNKEVSPLLTGGVGYALALKNGGNGLIYSIAVGLVYKISNKTSFVLEIGKKWQEITITQHANSYYSGYNSISRSKVAGFISFSLGLTF